MNVSIGNHSNSSCQALVGGWPDYQCQAVITVRQVSSSLSLICGLLVCFDIVYFRKWKNLSQRLILSFSCTSVVSSCFYLMSIVEPNKLPVQSFCTFTGWGVLFFDWSLLLWITCITVNILKNALQALHFNQRKWVEYIYYGVSWGLPAVLSVLPFTQGVFGRAGLWCWIINRPGWRFGLWYGPSITIPISFVIAYIVVTYRIRKLQAKLANENMMQSVVDADRIKTMLKNEVYPLWWYPLIFGLISLFPLPNRIQNIIDGLHPQFALVMIHTTISPLTGAVNAVIYFCQIDREALNPSEFKMAFRQWKERCCGTSEATRPVIELDVL